ncbi:MAG: FKBP-type peptidyl-prolyl cis-trans isomerase [Proteobacteria bacterium]|nr:FKBP-type peptidyl-prolyl cis-trans isomerase [Pseudomonadota bacterium]
MGGKSSPKVTELKTQPEKLGYALGSDLGKNFKKNEMEIDQNAFIQGFEDGLNDAKPLLTPEETKAIQQSAIAEMRTKMNEKRKLAFETNKKEGEEFLAENAKKEGVVTTASGLQYEVLTEGAGPVPTETDRVQVNYAGKLLDGTEFDSSYQRGKPSTFGVKGVIQGWTEALTMMKTGSKWRIYVPSELAYKDRGAGQKIGPNAALIFDIELISIEGSPEAKTEETPATEPEKKS